jgi:hypothetical protein
VSGVGDSCLFGATVGVATVWRVSLEVPESWTGVDATHVGFFAFGVSFEIEMSIRVVAVGDEWRYVLGWMLGLCEE